MKHDYTKLLSMIPIRRERLEKIASQHGLEQLPEITVINSSLEQLEREYGRKLEFEDSGYYSPEYVIVRKYVLRAYAAGLTVEMLDGLALRMIAHLLGTVTYNYKYGWVGLLLFWKEPEDSYWLRDFLVARYQRQYLQVLLEP